MNLSGSTSQASDITSLAIVSATPYTDITVLDLPASSCANVEIESLNTEYTTSCAVVTDIPNATSANIAELDFCEDMDTDISKSHTAGIEMVDIIPATSCQDTMNVGLPESPDANIILVTSCIEATNVELIIFRNKYGPSLLIKCFI